MELMEMKMEVVGSFGRGFASHACLTFAKGIPDSRMMELLDPGSSKSSWTLLFSTFNFFSTLQSEKHAPLRCAPWDEI
ncbi:hypothetical protein B0T20DRAFT_127627 [Sordaria brevicollis]|uniref:Uncharacterized protein n=1 Tax=Sordaria brevicollis TaxID=83679 RepID=A0AAE0PLX0_SORBR|nr:hypothetical protein B0T20DRAFT_127627 [Sordaria brevicollis]